MRRPQRNVGSDAKTPVSSPSNYRVPIAPRAFWNRRGRFRFHLRGMARSWTLHDTDALNAPQHPSLNNLWAARRTRLNSLRACRRCTRSQPSPHLSCLWRARVRGEKPWSPCAGCVTDLPLTCFCMLMSYITLDGSSLHQWVETKVCAKKIVHGVRIYS